MPQRNAYPVFSREAVRPDHKQLVKTPAQFAADNDYGHEWQRLCGSTLRQWCPALSDYVGVTKNERGLVIGSPDGGDYKIGGYFHVECKRRRDKGDFRSPEDFRYPTMFIDEEYKCIRDGVDRAYYYSQPTHLRKRLMKPIHSYWIANSDMTWVALILGASKPTWTLHHVPHVIADGRPATNWACPLNRVLFRPIDRMIELWDFCG